MISERLGHVLATCNKLNLTGEAKAFMESCPVRQIQPMLTLPLNAYQQPKSAGSVTEKIREFLIKYFEFFQGLYIW